MRLDSFYGLWEGWDPINQFNHTSWIAVVTPTDRQTCIACCSLIFYHCDDEYLTLTLNHWDNIFHPKRKHRDATLQSYRLPLRCHILGRRHWRKIIHIPINGTTNNSSTTPILKQNKTYITSNDSILNVEKVFLSILMYFVNTHNLGKLYTSFATTCTSLRIRLKSYIAPGN